VKKNIYPWKLRSFKFLALPIIKPNLQWRKKFRFFPELTVHQLKYLFWISHLCFPTFQSLFIIYEGLAPLLLRFSPQKGWDTTNPNSRVLQTSKNSKRRETGVSTPVKSSLNPRGLQPRKNLFIPSNPPQPGPSLFQTPAYSP
jgi:hypothetical protein